MANKSAIPVVYLVHFDAPYLHAGHHLGVARSERVARREVAAGFWQPLVASGEQPRLVDVWEVDTMAAARGLMAKFKRQGSRKRLCSVCSPGNARGAGRGKWVRNR